MKECYIYSNGEIIIEENNEIEKREYQDNIEKILETENIIEGIKKEKENFNESLLLRRKTINEKEKGIAIVIDTSIAIGILIMLLNPFNIASNSALLTFLISSVCSTGILSPIILSNLKKSQI